MTSKKLPIEHYKKKLEDAGYIVTRAIKYKLHSFEVEETLLRQFLTECRKRGPRIKDCINEAISDWLSKHRDGL